MKRNLLYIFFLSLTILSCTDRKKIRLHGFNNFKGVVLGDSVVNNNVRDLSAMLDLVQGGDREKVTIKGRVDNVAKDGANWLTIKLPNNDLMKVNFEDNNFSVPKDIKGKTVVLKGMAKADVLNIAQQKEIAQQIGLSKNAIDSIKSPKRIISFDAKGMVIL
ncbi:hypothetical protein A5893_11300 [Pedobacter psychrophilus]|uniref:DUF4920 domain-containing protein n=1 Tax=Pedobacter psychrophilus TaxID=1826909 RepID=A0A179DDX3_9SPHI|nr:DUF4920 domain-containing protein [Pedobacter psychrophilus]OAQ39245.1 hypothetical protein A5893_11300 [Pedobacter psychrophilus]